MQVVLKSSNLEIFISTKRFHDDIISLTCFIRLVSIEPILLFVLSVLPIHHVPFNIHYHKQYKFILYHLVWAIFLRLYVWCLLSYWCINKLKQFVCLMSVDVCWIFICSYICCFYVIVCMLSHCVCYLQRCFKLLIYQCLSWCRLLDHYGVMQLFKLWWV